MPIRVRIVYQEGNGVILSIWNVWKAGMLCRGEQGTRGDF